MATKPGFSFIVLISDCHVSKCSGCSAGKPAGVLSPAGLPANHYHWVVMVGFCICRVIPVNNIATRNAEIQNIEKLSFESDLTLNYSKSTQIGITDHKRKSRRIPQPPTRQRSWYRLHCISEDPRQHHLSVSEHVHSVISSCAQHL